MTAQTAVTLCPHCDAKLRVKDRALVGKQITCPDCHGPIEILSDGPASLRIVAMEGESSADTASSKRRSAHDKKTAEKKSQRSNAAQSNESPAADARTSQAGGPATADRARFDQVANVLRHPATIGWILAGGLAVVLAAVVLSDSDRADNSNGVSERARNAESERMTANVETDVEQSQHRAHRPDQKPTRDLAGNVPAGSNKNEDDVSARLEHLGQRVEDYVRTHGHFPVGTVAEGSLSPGERFGWLALLPDEEGEQGGVSPLWDRSWRDPLNARFVRRRRTEFQNPEIEQLVGSAGYPATHFVGMAGVGDDAALLPVDHRRAGIFGYERRTTVDDVKDGLANTILSAGVQEHLGAWAAGGRASVRGFSRRPYVNGPDGFGSGQPDGMFVLTADGRARFISKAADPALLERMAAMSDESRKITPTKPSPADPDPTRDPELLAGKTGGNAVRPNRRGDAPVAAPLPRDLVGAAGRVDDAAELSATDDEDADQVDSEHREPPKPIDVAAALKQPIRRFEQADPVPFRELLLQMEELVGVPIRADGPETADLDKLLEVPVSATLERTTVGEILETVVEQVGLSYDIEADEIRLRPQTAGDPGS